MTNVTKLHAKPTVPELDRPAHSVPADDLVAAGKRLRDTVPRASQGAWKRPKDRRDPLGNQSPGFIARDMRHKRGR